MGDLQWYFIPILAIVMMIGGAIGAAIYGTIFTYRNQKPLISRKIDFLTKFEEMLNADDSQNYPTLTDGQKEYRYNSLHPIQIELLNTSHQNFDEFKFGITLDQDDVAVYIAGILPDRHHKIEQLTPVNLSNPKSQIDFILRPFNRKDSYSLQLLIYTSEEKQFLGKIEISSPEAVQFVDLPTAKELLEEAASRASISLGMLKISLTP